MPLKGGYLDYMYNPTTRKRTYPVGKLLVEGTFTYNDSNEQHNPAFLDADSHARMVDILEAALTNFPGLTYTGIDYGSDAVLTGPNLEFEFFKATEGKTITAKIGAIGLVDVIESNHVKRNSFATVLSSVSDWLSTAARQIGYERPQQ